MSDYINREEVLKTESYCLGLEDMYDAWQEYVSAYELAQGGSDDNTRIDRLLAWISDYCSDELHKHAVIDRNNGMSADDMFKLYQPSFPDPSKLMKNRKTDGLSFGIKLGRRLRTIARWTNFDVEG